jgi:hypothetical protein
MLNLSFHTLTGDLLSSTLIDHTLPTGAEAIKPRLGDDMTDHFTLVICQSPSAGADGTAVSHVDMKRTDDQGYANALPARGEL